mgnify:CR=1 FL=1
MTFKFSDFNAPSGHYVATGASLLPLGSYGGTVAFVGSAVHSGIGDPNHAAEVDAAMTWALSATTGTGPVGPGAGPARQ